MLIGVKRNQLNQPDPFFAEVAHFSIRRSKSSGLRWLSGPARLLQTTDSVIAPRAIQRVRHVPVENTENFVLARRSMRGDR